MAQTLRIQNYRSINIIDRTQLTSNIAIGVTSLPVSNSANFKTDFVLIGEAGSKDAELIQSTNPAGATTVSLVGPTTLQHFQFDPILALFGNQIKVYRALDAGLGQQPPDSAFAVLPNMPIAINANNELTTFTDPTGSGSYWYKITYYNSVTTGETDLGASVAVRGLFTVNYCSLDEVREYAGFKYSKFISDDTIDTHRQAAQDEINGALDEFYQTPLQPPINDFIRDITKRLAAGKLRLSQYTAVSDPKINGQDMYDGAQLDLDKLITKERVLTNKQGQALDGPGSTGGVEGWPNSATANTAGCLGGSRRQFRMSDIQGRPQGTDQSGNPSGNLFYGRAW